MKWSYWISLYIRTHCVARGLRPLTLAAYEDTLRRFSEWIRVTHSDRSPDAVCPRDVLQYLQHLREDRSNGDSAVNRTVTIVRGFYSAMVAMGHLDHRANPLIGFPTIKAVPRKLPVSLSSDQVNRLLVEPKPDTVIGLRDRALLALLYGSGIRATECASLCNGQVDLTRLTITVRGKGGHERSIPLHPQLVEVQHHSSDLDLAGRCLAPQSTSACTRGVNAAASGFLCRHIACDTLSRLIWCAPVLVSLRSEIFSDIGKLRAHKSICTSPQRICDPPQPSIQ